MTINTHSLVEENYDEKCSIFVKTVLEIKPDVIAMQEVNQTSREKCVNEKTLLFFIPDPDSISLKCDNHALKIATMLEKENMPYYFTWTGIKQGYKKYDEGLAILSLTPPENVCSFFISKSKDYKNWRTRKALRATVSGTDIYCVHTGWWEDTQDAFSGQWETLKNSVKKDKLSFLMGDFNSPAENKNEGYSLIINDGFYDTFNLALCKDSGVTVKGKIAGWGTNCNRRIDYIFSNKKINVKSSHTIFNGDNTPTVSDHFGVLCEIQGGGIL